MNIQWLPSSLGALSSAAWCTHCYPLSWPWLSPFLADGTPIFLTLGQEALGLSLILYLACGEALTVLPSRSTLNMSTFSVPWCPSCGSLCQHSNLSSLRSLSSQRRGARSHETVSGTIALQSSPMAKVTRVSLRAPGISCPHHPNHLCPPWSPVTLRGAETAPALGHRLTAP